MKEFSGKVAAITGAGSGIGRHLAIELAQQGCHLALSDVDGEGLEGTVRRVDRYPVSVIADRLDVADREAMTQWAEKVVADHGRVNLIFNNAGVALGSTVEAMSYEDLEWLLSINLWGVIHGTKAFLPHLKASGEGHVINISSVFGLSAQPTQSAYNISKYGVRGFTESLRQELDLEDCGVSATCVHPGGIKTNIARASRKNDSIRLLTGNDSDDVATMEKMFRTTPEKAAQTILSGVRKNRRRVLIGGDAWLIDVVVRLFPAFYQRLLVALLRRRQSASSN